MKKVKNYRRAYESERNTIRKDWKGRIKIALIYPNSYHVGMSNLGFQTVYRIFNNIDYVVCERAFYPEDGYPGPAGSRALQRQASAGPKQHAVATVESGRPLTDFDIIAFSVSFENDYPGILSILARAGFPLQSEERDTPHPLVIAGGVACTSNPEPLSSFIDCFLIGEAEEMLARLIEIYRSAPDRASCLKSLAQQLPGAYVPAFYRTTYHDDGSLHSFKAIMDVPEKIQRAYVKDLSDVPTTSAILTSDTSFDSTFLIEVARGCAHGCRFCSAGYIYRPPRFRPFSLLETCVQQGILAGDKIGLVGAAVSDLPEIEKLCGLVDEKDVRISFSSLRADALSGSLIATLRKSRIKTATIAPDAGSQRMRDVINKGITESDILNAAEMLVAGGILNLKLYFMIGLPFETQEDIEAIISLCKKVKHRFLKSSRAKKRIGEITISLNCFVPKPSTPFQWVAMEEEKSLKQKIKQVKTGLKRVANLRVHADIVRWAFIQALFSRGDRKTGRLLSLAHENQGNWAQTLKASPINAHYYVCRERPFVERLPWDFIDHGIDKSFLMQEYLRAKQGQTSPACHPESCTLCGVC
ncbi:MAG: TIGR03960 family B12-binding radical SAM protein [Desulfobacterales bacterium]|nr:TIGR03960 family B12-binding radical SAM protein [Desulfobacterales bacterium]